MSPSNNLKISIRRKEDCSDLPLPCYATGGSSGMDLYADVDGSVIIDPGEIRLISAGIFIELPYGYEAQIRPRSGLALKHGITMVNTPGTIDSDYRGLISVIMINLSKKPYTVSRGDRIAQMVIQKVIRADLEECDLLGHTERSDGGFGHTGLK